MLQKLLFMGLVPLLASFALWRRHLWTTIINIPLQKDTFEPKNPLSFYFLWVFVLSVLIFVGQGSESLLAYFNNGQVHAILSNNLPYWVFLASRNTKLLPTFSILDQMEPQIHALGTFWLDIFVDHSLRHAIFCLYWRLVLFVAHLLQHLSHVHVLPCVNE